MYALCFDILLPFSDVNKYTLVSVSGQDVPVRL